MKMKWMWDGRMPILDCYVVNRHKRSTSKTSIIVKNHKKVAAELLCQKSNDKTRGVEKPNEMAFPAPLLLICLISMHYYHYTVHTIRTHAHAPYQHDNDIFTNKQI